MTSVLDILNEIAADTKKSHKQQIVEKYKDNADFRLVIHNALNPYVNFYIKKIPEYTASGKESLSWALQELSKLSLRKITGHAGIEHLRTVLSSVNHDDAIVIARVISKDLRCGIAEGIVNSVIKDYIPSYPCLLARPYDEKNIKRILYPAFSQLKADGLRANALCGEELIICGRSGRPIDLLGHLDESVNLLKEEYGHDLFIDGEFVVVDKNERVIDRKTGNGIISKAIKGTISDQEAAMVRFQVWDAFPLNQFHSGKSKENYDSRFTKLLSKIDRIRAKGIANFKIIPIPFKVVNNFDEVISHFNEMLEQKYEGTILKDFDGIWSDTRSPHLIKFKAEKTCDLEITGFKPGTGKFAGMVGSLEMSSSDRLVEANISGFPDDLRKWISENIEQLVGSIAEVTYNERIKSKARPDIDSLFLPRFSSLRHDKKIADSTKEIT